MKPAIVAAIAAGLAGAAGAGAIALGVRKRAPGAPPWPSLPGTVQTPTGHVLSLRPSPPKSRLVGSVAAALPAFPPQVDAAQYYSKGFQLFPPPKNEPGAISKVTETPPALLRVYWEGLKKGDLSPHGFGGGLKGIFAERFWNKNTGYDWTGTQKLAEPVHIGPSPEGHSHASILIFRPENAVSFPYMDQNGVQHSGEWWGWFWTDEFGRPFEGWGDAGDIFSVALHLAQIILPMIPGLGTAAAAAIGAAVALSQGKSLEDAALAAARAALPPEAQVAFDAAVAAANGKPIGEATETALMNQLPGGKDAYVKGLAVANAAKKGWG